MKTFICLICSLWLSFAVHAAELKFEPASPIVEINKTVTLSVANTEGTVKWSAGVGKIQGEGNKVTYLAPDQAGLDAVTVLDSKGVGSIRIVITPPNNFSPENAQWEVFANRHQINALLLSEDGKTLWVGTTGGLEKRDVQTGEILRVFTNLDGLPSNYISALLSDGRGGLWVGTDGGLVRYIADGQWQVLNQENSGLPSNDIAALLSDDQGGLWIGTRDGLAHYTADGQWEVFNKNNSGLSDNWINTLLSDNQGGLWIGSGWRGKSLGGLAHYTADRQWQVFNENNSGLPDNDVYALLSDDQGGLWIGTGGLAHYTADGQRQVFNENNSGLPANYVTALSSDNLGGRWIGTGCDKGSCVGGGLAHYTVDGQWQVFNENNSGLPDNDVTALLSDNQGGLWIGTYYGGLSPLHC